MDLHTKHLIDKFVKREISKEEFVEGLPSNLKNNSNEFRNFLLEIIKSKNPEDLQNALTIMWLLRKEKEQNDILNELIIQNWHTRHEDIIHELQKQKNPKSIPYIKEAMQSKYDYLVSFGTGIRQFISQCGHALSSIGTKEAIKVIEDLSKSNDPIMRDEMLYRLSKINNVGNYTRNYDFDN